MNVYKRASAVKAAVAIVILQFSAAARAELPMLKGIETPQPLGPVTEAVDFGSYQHILHVWSTGKGGKDSDGSKERPYQSLQQAMQAIGEAGPANRHAVLVSAGTYRTVNLQMKRFVDLFGGFDGSWNRDVSNLRSVLDAHRAGPVVRGADDARLDGFVLVNGQNTGPGGAIVCEHVSPVISNNVIRDNATVEPQDFRQDMIHQRGTGGGAIALLAGSTAVVRNNLVCQNETGIGSGGGIYVRNECKPRISNNVICGNRAGIAGRPGEQGSRSSNGGGIAVSFDCQPEITGNAIVMNSVADNSDGGGIHLEYDANALIRGNWVVGNAAKDDGGGMYVMKNSEPVVEYNLFAGNRTPGGGSGAIRLSKEGRMHAMNNLFVSNFGNSLDAVNSWMVLKNNTFAGGPEHAIIFENEKQHFAPSAISGNVFLGTHTPVLTRPGRAIPAVVNNFVQGNAADRGEANGGANFLDDSCGGSIATARYDRESCSTTLEVSAGTELPAAGLSGRAINVGDRWSVIRASDGDTLAVWGDVTGQADTFWIAGTYRPAQDSPAREFGAYVARPVEEKK